MVQIIEAFPELLFDVTDYEGDNTYRLDIAIVLPNNPVFIQGYLYNIANANIDTEIYYDSNFNGTFDSTDTLVAQSNNSGTESESIEYLAENPGFYFGRVFNVEGSETGTPSFNFTVIPVLQNNVIPISQTNTTSNSFELQSNNPDSSLLDVIVIEAQFPTLGRVRANISSDSTDSDINFLLVEDSNENGILDAEDEILGQSAINSTESSQELVFAVSESTGFLVLDNNAEQSVTVNAEISYDVLASDNPPLTLEQGTAQIAYVAYYGRPGDSSGLNFWNNVLAQQDIEYSPRSGDTLTNDEQAVYDQLTSSFGDSDEANRFYGALDNTQRINQIYNNAFDRNGENTGLNYWTTQLDEGNLDLTKLALEIALGAQNEDLLALQNKIESANLFSQGIDTSEEIAAYSGAAGEAFGREWLSNFNMFVANQTNVDTALSTLVGGVII